MKNVENVVILCFWVTLLPLALFVAGVAFLFGIGRAQVAAMEANGEV